MQDRATRDSKWRGAAQRIQEYLPACHHCKAVGWWCKSPCGKDTGLAAERKGFSAVSLLPGMVLFVRGTQVGDGESGVVLEGVQGLVAKQILDVVHVRAGT